MVVCFWGCTAQKSAMSLESPPARPCERRCALCAQHLARFIVAVPTAAGSAYRELRPEVDELVALMRPEPFYGVGASYEDFSQMSDAEVIDLLERARSFLTRRRRRG